MKFGKIIYALLACICIPAWAADTDWPSRPIRFVEPYAPGGAADITARTLSQQLTASLGQPVIIDNKTGAGGNIGTDIVAKSAPDGYTMLLAYTGPMLINQYLYQNLPFDPARDFVPVAMVADAPLILVVHPSVPATDLTSLIAYARENPGKLFYGSSGTGGADHLAGELFNLRTGTKIVHVPYKGGAPAVLDLVAGRTQIEFVTIPGGLAHIRSGRLRPIAILSKQRFELFPEVPTIAEAGLVDFDINNWYGLAMPAGTPAPIVETMNAAVHAALEKPELRARLLEVGVVPSWKSSADFADFLKREAPKWENIVRASGAKVE